MNVTRTLTMTLAVAIFAAPFAVAHIPPAPSNECQNLPGGLHPVTSHDYTNLNLGIGLSVTSGNDGNLTNDCDGDTIPADFDGEIEHAFSGGWFIYSLAAPAPACQSPATASTVPIVCDVNAATAARIDAPNSGATACYSALSTVHHGAGITITDVLLGGDPGLTLTADWRRVNDAGETAFVATGSSTGNENFDHNCGDNLVEACDPADPTEADQVTCNSRDARTFQLSLVGATSPTTASRTLAAPLTAGQDGAIVAFVAQGTTGHLA